MKKITFSLLLASFLVFSVLPVLAQDVKTAPSINPVTAFETIINVVFTALLIFAALTLIIAGFDFATAGGDSEKVKKAREKVLYAVIGIVVAFLAKGIVLFIENMF